MVCFPLETQTPTKNKNIKSKTRYFRRKMKILAQGGTVRGRMLSRNQDGEGSDKCESQEGTTHQLARAGCWERWGSRQAGLDYVGKRKD